MNKHLVVTDFDGTLAKTFEDSPNGMNVHRSSELAIRDLFGVSGIQVYHDIGGLQNREPGELVRIVRAITGQVDMSEDEAIRSYIDAKLNHTLPEISPKWPQLYPGVKNFLQKATRDGYFVDVAILSSGHDVFIKRALEVNGIDPSSLIIVTSDVLREREMPHRPRHKPYSYQFAEAHKGWLEKKGLLPQSDDPADRESYVGRSLGKPNILYIGDDPIKDGGLAAEARVPFIFVPFTKPDFVPSPERGQLLVSDFEELDDILDYQHGDELGVGQSFAQALLDKRDEELFPPLPDGEIYAGIMKERSFS